MVNEKAVEMFVGGLVLDPNTQAPVVLLKDETGELTLPIWIGIAEATSIASAIKQVTLPRPLTHDLMHNALAELGVRVQRVIITELRDDTYFAELIVSSGDKVIILDSRPSDAIAMALRAAAPIFVTQEVLDRARVSMPQPPPGAEQAPAEGDPANTDGQNSEGQADNAGKDLSGVAKDKWDEILQSLDPDDFKYKM